MGRPWTCEQQSEAICLCEFSVASLLNSSDICLCCFFFVIFLVYFSTHFILFSVLFSLNWRLKYENRSVFFLYHSPFFCMVSWAIVLHRTLVSVSTCLLFIWLRVFLQRTCVFNTYVSVCVCFCLVRLNSTNYFQSWAT